MLSTIRTTTATWTVGASRRFITTQRKNNPFVTALVFLLGRSFVSSTSPAFVWTPSKMSNTLRDGSGTITVTPKNEAEQSALVVICHGLGDTSEGFADVAEFLSKELPYIKFILPTAPTNPVTMNMGMPMPSWYDIVGLDERSNENCKGIQDSQERIKNILDTEHTSTGLPYSRMLLAGFSQGGALSLFTGLQLSEKLAGIVIMSGYLPSSKSITINNDEVKQVPILHCHGEADPLVIHDNALKSRTFTTETLGIENYELKSYPGLVHSVSNEELADVLEFLKTVLPEDNTCRIQLKDVSDMSVKELKEAIRRAGISHMAKGFTEKQEFRTLLQDHRDGKL